MKISKKAKLLLILVVVYTITLIVHYVYTHYIDLEMRVIISDQIVIYTRGRDVLFGRLPYRDFYTNAAALSPYVWAPMAMLAMFSTKDFSLETVWWTNYESLEGMMAFTYIIRGFFVLCIILATFLLYKIEYQKKNKRAFLIALLFGINPFFLNLVSFWGSDESVLPLLILLPIYFFERGNSTIASFLIGLGATIKYFPILLAPLIWIYGKKWRERIYNSIIFIAVVIAANLPFYFISKDRYMMQFEDIIGEGGNHGIATVVQAYFGVNLEESNFVFLVIELILLALVGGYLFVRRKKWTYYQTSALLLVHLITYQKMHSSYIVMVFPFLFVALFQKGIVRWLNGLMYITGFFLGSAAVAIVNETANNRFLEFLCWDLVLLFYVCMTALIVIYMKSDYLLSVNSFSAKDRLS